MMFNEKSFKQIRPYDRSSMVPSPMVSSALPSSVTNRRKPMASRLIDTSFSFSFRNDSFNQSSITDKSRHILKSYGSILPVTVVEAIASDVSSLSSLSVKMTEHGWSCLVCGRRLFVWIYKQIQQNRVSSCYVLQLPPSDLSHKAELVCVFDTDDKSQHIPATIAVSPEGIIRYWPNIAYEGHSIETTVNDLQGQECLSLTDIRPYGCILGTTTSSLVHVNINNVDGHNTITCRTLKVPQGMLRGFGRKVNSFIFGAMPATQSAETKQLIRVLRDTAFSSTEFDVEQYIWVLAAFSIQKWQIIDQYSDRLIGDYDIERPVKEAFLDKVWNRETTHPNQIQIWPIDISVRKTKEIILLVAGLNADVSNQLYYAFAILNNNTNQWSNSSVSFSSFTVLRNHTVCYTEDDEEQLLNLKLLTGTANNTALYIYNHNRVLCVLMGIDDVDVIDFSGNDDGILGAGVCDGLPLFFTRKDAIVSIIPPQVDLSDPKEVSHVDDYIDDGDDNDVSVLRKAFTLFVKGESVRCQSLLTKYFPQLPGTSDDNINYCVTTLSRELCDEIPHSDPRWAETGITKTAESTQIASSIISNQIEEKLRTHHLLIEFLKISGIWERLTTLVVKGTTVSTQISLSDNAEKLIAAIKFRELHAEYNLLLDEAIKIVLHERSATIPARLTPHDVFFREVTKIDDAITALITYEENQINNALSKNLKDILAMIISVCEVFVHVFRDVCSYRQKQGLLYETSMNFKCEYVPWSSTTGPNGIRGSLIKQFDFLVNFGIESITVTSAIDEDIQLKGIIYQRIVEMADIILDGYVWQLRSIERETERYRVIERSFELFRAKSLKPLMKVRQYDRAAALAEKYDDFDILIRICEELDNSERLHRYMTELSNKGFAQFLFNWYIKEGKEGKMLKIAANAQLLSDFLKNHNQINWLHQIHLKQYKEASVTLKDLAFKEQHYLGRRKTLFSLSKLASLTAGDKNVNDIDEQLELSLNQELEFQESNILE